MRPRDGTSPGVCSRHQVARALTGCKDWPSGTQASNITIVWVGSGSFPMSVLPGMTLTTDRTVRDSAVARWKERHGCTAIDQACTKLHTPDPY